MESIISSITSLTIAEQDRVIIAVLSKRSNDTPKPSLKNFKNPTDLLNMLEPEYKKFVPIMNETIDRLNKIDMMKKKKPMTDAVSVAKNALEKYYVEMYYLMFEILDKDIDALKNSVGIELINEFNNLNLYYSGDAFNEHFKKVNDAKKVADSLSKDLDDWMNN